MSFSRIDEILFNNKQAIPQQDYVDIMNEIHEIFKGKPENMIKHTAIITISTRFRIINKNDLIDDDISLDDLSECEEAEDVEIISQKAHIVKLPEEINMIEHYNNITRWDIANKLQSAEFQCLCIYLDVDNIDSHLDKINEKMTMLNSNKDIIYKKYNTTRYFSSIRVFPEENELLIPVPEVEEEENSISLINIDIDDYSN